MTEAVLSGRFTFRKKKGEMILVDCININNTCKSNFCRHSVNGKNIINAIVTGFHKELLRCCVSRGNKSNKLYKYR